MSLFTKNNSTTIASPLAAKMSELLIEAWNPTSPVVVAPFVPANVRIPVPDVPNPIWNDGVASPASGPVDNNDPTTTVSPMKELVDIYRRLRDTMIKNELSHNPTPTLAENSQNDLCGSETLARTLGISISSVEIQQRGVKAQAGMTLLDTIPQQAITHLRVLAETASSYVSVGGIKYAGDNRVAKEFCEDYERQYYQLFMREPYSAENRKARNNQVAPLLDQDIFVFLTECTLCLAQVDEIEIMHLVRLCYLAELVKVVLKMGHLMDSSTWKISVGAAVNNGENFANFTGFYNVIWSRDKPNSQAVHDRRKAIVDHHGLAKARAFVQAYATAFLRKVVVLMHVRYGIIFHNHISTNLDAPEYVLPA
jgi:E3 ubiquitin-protein ligase UBR1